MNDNRPLLIDTSIWIDFFRNAPAVILDVQQALVIQNVVGLDVVFGELLQGIRKVEDHKIILDLYSAINIIPDNHFWLDAGDLSLALRKKGFTVGLIDCYIASVALKHDFIVWSNDKGFQDIQKINPALQLKHSHT